jgi:methyl-accepting chemotaxis protein
MKLQRDLQMSAISNSAESRSVTGSLPAKRQLVEKVAIDPADLKDDQLQSEGPSLGKRFQLTLAPITFFIGVAATLAWQSYGDGARKGIASSFPRLGWLAPQAAPVAPSTRDIVADTASANPSPDQRQLDDVSPDFDEVRQSVDRIATSIVATQEHMTQSVDRIAAGQERIAQTVDQLATGQEQMSREVAKLQAIEQYILYRNSQPPLPKPVPRQLQARTAH